MHTTPSLRNAVGCALLGLTLGASPSHATVMVLQSIDQMTDRASMVVRAVPVEGSESSRWTGPNATGLIVTTRHFKVLETLAGDVQPNDEIVVEQYGGAVGEIGMAIGGMATYVPGEQVLLFVRRDVDGVLRVLDVSAGKFEVVPGPAGSETLTRRDLAEVGVVGGRAVAVPLTLDEMRDAVQRAAAAQGGRP
jgi:hypothetical protein